MAKHLGVTEEEIEQDRRCLETPSKSKKPPTPSKQDTSRHVALELLSIEGNYAKSLEYLMKEYKKPLEDNKIISTTECKQIFGNLDDLVVLHKKVEQGKTNIKFIMFDLSL